MSCPPKVDWAPIRLWIVRKVRYSSKVLVGAVINEKSPSYRLTSWIMRGQSDKFGHAHWPQHRLILFYRSKKSNNHSCLACRPQLGEFIEPREQPLATPVVNSCSMYTGWAKKTRPLCILPNIYRKLQNISSLHDFLHTYTKASVYWICLFPPGLVNFFHSLAPSGESWL